MIAVKSALANTDNKDAASFPIFERFIQRPAWHLRKSFTAKNCSAMRLSRNWWVLSNLLNWALSVLDTFGEMLIEYFRKSSIPTFNSVQIGYPLTKTLFVKHCAWLFYGNSSKTKIIGIYLLMQTHEYARVRASAWKAPHLWVLPSWVLRDLTKAFIEKISDGLMELRASKFLLCSTIELVCGTG